MKDKRIKQIMPNIGVSTNKVDKLKHLPQILEIIFPKDEDLELLIRFGKGITIKKLLC